MLTRREERVLPPSKYSLESKLSLLVSPVAVSIRNMENIPFLRIYLGGVMPIVYKNFKPLVCSTFYHMSPELQEPRTKVPKLYVKMVYNATLIGPWKSSTRYHVVIIGYL